MFEGLLSLIKWLLNLSQVGADTATYFAIEDAHRQLDDAASIVFSGKFDSVINIFVPVGTGLLVIYFLLDLIDKTSADNFNIDIFILSFAKLIGGLILVTNAKEFMHGLYGISSMFSEMIIGLQKDAVVKGLTTASLNRDISSIWDFISFIIDEALNFISGSGSLLLMGAVTVANQVFLGIVANVRAVKLGLKTIISPIVLADVGGHGFSTNSMHYLKSVFALCMQEPIILCVLFFLSTTTQHVNNLSFVAVVPFALVFVEIKLLFSSVKISEDIFG